MKRAILSSKTRFKKPIGNIHFGKIVLVLFLVLGQVLTVNSNKTEASEQLYWYNKYGVLPAGQFIYRTGYIIAEDSRDKLDDGTWSKTTSTYFTVGEYTWSGFDFIVSTSGIKLTPNYIAINSYSSNRSTTIAHSITNIRSETFNYGDSNGTLTIGDGYIFERNSTKPNDRIKDRLVGENIPAKLGDYPADGIHTDGFWYVLVGLANENPTITTSTSGGVILGENSYFGKQIVAYRQLNRLF